MDACSEPIPVIDFSLLELKSPTHILKDYCVAQKKNLHEINGTANYEALMVILKGRFCDPDQEEMSIKPGFDFKKDWVAGRYILMAWILMKIQYWNAIMRCYDAGESCPLVEEIMAETKLYYDEWRKEEERINERATIPDKWTFYLGGPGDMETGFEGTDMSDFIPQAEEVTDIIDAIIDDEEIDLDALMRNSIHEESVDDMVKRVRTRMTGIKGQVDINDITSDDENKSQKLSIFIGALFLTHTNEITMEQKVLGQSPIMLKATKGLKTT